MFIFVCVYKQRKLELDTVTHCATEIYSFHQNIIIVKIQKEPAVNEVKTAPVFSAMKDNKCLTSACC